MAAARIEAARAGAKPAGELGVSAAAGSVSSTGRLRAALQAGAGSWGTRRGFRSQVLEVLDAKGALVRGQSVAVVRVTILADGRGELVGQVERGEPDSIPRDRYSDLG